MNEAEIATGDAVDTRYLDGLLGFQLRCAQLAVFRDIIASFEGIPITVVQFSALCVIRDNPGISQADLAAAIEVDRPRMVPILDALERQGWTERKTGTSDRRVRRICLTPAGEDILGQLDRRFEAHQQRLESRIGTEGMAQLAGILGKLSGRLSG